MLWLRRPQLLRWAVVIVLACVSLWIELRPDPTQPHPFAVVDIGPGDEITDNNTELRQVPRGLFEPVELGAAISPIAAGEPVLASHTDETRRTVPSGWWNVTAKVPRGANIGEKVRILVLSTGETVDGVVTEVESEDPFLDETGSIAVAPEHSTSVAMAAAQDQIVVMVATG